MHSKTNAFAVALSALALASPAAASLGGFRLPGDQPRPERPPDVQGPVAPDVPASRRNPAAPAPTPSPTVARPAPTPTTSPQPIEVPTGLQAPPAARRVAALATAAPTPAPTTAADLPPAEPAAVPPPGAAAPVPADLPGSAPALTPRAEDGRSWRWLLAAVPLLLAVLALAGWAARRRARRPAGPVAVPQIERPRLGPAPPQPVAGLAAAEPLQVSLEPLRLSLTLLNATLAYRLALANHGPTPLTGLAIGADMIAAHASMSREEQLSGPGNGAAARRIARLEPGETRVVEGEFRLPFPQIVPIRQGDAALLLPLARFRVEAEGARPLVRTFVVGQPGQGSGLQPFRLDLGPRVYPRLAQHAFA